MRAHNHCEFGKRPEPNVPSPGTKAPRAGGISRNADSTKIISPWCRWARGRGRCGEPRKKTNLSIPPWLIANKQMIAYRDECPSHWKIINNHSKNWLNSDKSYYTTPLNTLSISGQRVNRYLKKINYFTLLIDSIWSIGLYNQLFAFVNTNRNWMNHRRIMNAENI